MDCGNTEFLVGRSARTNEENSTTNMEQPIACVSAYVPRAMTTNEENSTTNMEQPIACVSACVPRAMTQFLKAKNMYCWNLQTTD